MFKQRRIILLTVCTVGLANVSLPFGNFPNNCLTRWRACCLCLFRIMKILYSAGNMAERFSDLAMDAGSCRCGTCSTSPDYALKH